MKVMKFKANFSNINNIRYLITRIFKHSNCLQSFPN